MRPQESYQMNVESGWYLLYQVNVLEKRWIKRQLRGLNIQMYCVVPTE